MWWAGAVGAIVAWMTEAAAAPPVEACASAARAVQTLWQARAAAEAVADKWPEWRPTLIEVRVRTREGWELDVARGQPVSCPGLPLPARVLGRVRPAAASSITLERRGDRYWIALTEGRDGDLAPQDVLATLVHLHFHVHQYRHELPYRDVHPRGSAPDAGWAWRNIPTTQDGVRRMGALAEQILADGFTPEAAMALVTVRRQQAAAMRGGHPRLPRAVALQERFEGLAVYIEHQLVTVDAARQVLIEAGVPEAQLDPARWRQEALAADAGFPAATGFAAALVLDAAGGPWKEELGRSGFDALLELAAIRAVQ